MLFYFPITLDQSTTSNSIKNQSQNPIERQNSNAAVKIQQVNENYHLLILSLL